MQVEAIDSQMSELNCAKLVVSKAVNLGFRLLLYRERKRTLWSSRE